MAEVKAHQTKARYPLLGKVVDGRYHLIGGLGQGGLGTVYLAQHLHLEQLFAVKFLDLETVGIDADKRQRKEYQTDFMKEAKVASMIRHESVVKVIDFGEFEGLPYLVMEYVPGPSLLQMITERGRFTVPEATNIALCIARALSAFHERQLVHRDLKPANVILDPRGGGQLTLVDLGLVKDISGPAGRASTHPTALRGTPGYLAPEQVPSWVLSGIGQEVTGGKKLVDARVDMYALGVIFYEMLAGVSPYPDGSNTSIIIYACTKPPLPITGVEPPVRLVPGLEALIYDTMARDPERRPQSANAFIQRLENLARVPTPRESWPVIMPDSAAPATIQPVRSHHRVMPSNQTRALGTYEDSHSHKTDAIDIIDDDDPFYTAHDGATSLQGDFTVELDEDSIDGYMRPHDYMRRESLEEVDDFAMTRVESLAESANGRSQSGRSRPSASHRGPDSVIRADRSLPGARLTWILFPVAAILIGATVWYFGLRPTQPTTPENQTPVGQRTASPAANPVLVSPIQPTIGTMPQPASATGAPAVQPVVQPKSIPVATQPTGDIEIKRSPTGKAGVVTSTSPPLESNALKKVPATKPSPPSARNKVKRKKRPLPVKSARNKPARPKRAASKLSLTGLERKADQSMKRLDWKGCFTFYSQWLKQAGQGHANYYRIESRMALCRSKMKNSP